MSKKPKEGRAVKKAKIIVLSGQSNAVGVGYIKCLSRSFTDEKIKEYVDGYEKVKINYSSHDKRSDGFTATAANGTELHKQTIGPELGIAEYLSERFPDEEFFIVKFAVGAASLMRDYLSPSSGGYYGFKGFKNEYRGFINAFLAGEPVKAGWCYNGLVELLHDSIACLEEKGYIRREPLANDKRQFSVFPTEKMQAILPEVRAASQEWMALLSKGIPEDELAIFDSVLERMQERAREIIEEQEEIK